MMSEYVGFNIPPDTV